MDRKIPDSLLHAGGDGEAVVGVEGREPAQPKTATLSGPGHHSGSALTGCTL